MEPLERMKHYMAIADISRRWISVMDAKAGSVIALNVAALGFAWTHFKNSGPMSLASMLFFLANVLFLVSLWRSLTVLLPRTTLSTAHRAPTQYVNGFEPLSFFGYVAKTYPLARHQDFLNAVEALDATALAREALEQHYTISLVVATKAENVAVAGWMWLMAVGIFVLSLATRGV